MMDGIKDVYEDSRRHKRSTTKSENHNLVAGLITGACATVIATAFLGSPSTRTAFAAVVVFLATSVLYHRAERIDEKPLHEFYPHELLAADESNIDWDALTEEIGKTRRDYELPTTPDGDDGPWLDRLELCQDVARHIRDGGEIDIDRVVDR